MKTTSTLVLLIVVLGIIGFAMYALSSPTPNGNVVVNGNAGTPQQVTLSMKNGNYYPQTITVKAGQPVAINLDSSIVGCYRTFTIRALGIAQNLKTPSDTLTFTPTTPGTYKFACSMGMGTGTLIVE